MLGKKEFKQEGKKESTNIQGENVAVNIGVSYEDARQISLDVYKSNFIELSASAAEIAYNRVKKLTDELIEKIKVETPENLKNIKDPDVQHAIYSAQQNYARSGNEEMKNTLNSVLIERIKINDQSLKKIVLNEAIQVIPKLTNRQLDVLTVVFILRQTKNFNVKTFDDFKNYLSLTLLKLVNNLTTEASSYQHLEFTGCCGSKTAGSKYLTEVLLHNYRHIFQKGFSQEKFNKAINSSSALNTLLIKNYFNPTLFSLDILDENDLRKKVINDFDSTETIFQNLKELYYTHIFNIVEAQDKLLENMPTIRPFIYVWEHSRIINMYTTSVGTAIAVTNANSKLGSNYDLDIWIK